MISDPALIVLDAQKKFSEDVDPGKEVISAIADFVDRYRATGRTPIFVRGLHHPYTMSENWHNKYDRPLEDVYNVGAEGTEIDPALDVRETDPVITKHRYSAFYQTDLELHLASNDVDRVMLAGFGTTGAVISTALAAFNRDYLITVLSDCVTTRYEEQHTAALEIIGSGYGAVKDSSEIEIGPIDEEPFGYTQDSVSNTVPWQGASDSRTEQ